MGLEFSDFKQFEARLRRALKPGQMDEFKEDLLDNLTAYLLKGAIDNTPVKTGNLRRQWTGGEDVKPQSFVSTIKIEKGNGFIQKTISNGANYALYVEEGTRIHPYGRHMLRRAEISLKKNAGTIIKRKVERKLKETFK